MIAASVRPAPTTLMERQLFLLASCLPGDVRPRLAMAAAAAEAGGWVEIPVIRCHKAVNWQQHKERWHGT
eukprot:5381896-Karenia_brevis.AAC.1